MRSVLNKNRLLGEEVDDKALLSDKVMKKKVDISSTTQKTMKTLIVSVFSNQALVLKANTKHVFWTLIGACSHTHTDCVRTRARARVVCVRVGVRVCI